MNVAEKIERINRIMRSNNYKLTIQRAMIARVLLEHESGLPSAEEVHNHLKKTSSSIARATVYRTLEIFSEINVVLKIKFIDSVTRFCVRADECSHMDHYLLCANCGNLEAIQEDWLLEAEKRLEQEYGFMVTDHLLIFKGIHQRSLQSEAGHTLIKGCSCFFEDRSHAIG